MSNKNYIDDLMRNYPLDTESPDENMIQVGGKSEEDRPTGGFPPIYFCIKIEPTGNLETKEETKPKREFGPPSSTVSIKSIMEKRRKVTSLS